MQRTGEVLWAIGLVCLPITTFPLLSSLTGAVVAPLSILPFGLLLVISVIPLILHKGQLPKEMLPLVIFIFVVIISCAAAFFLPIPGFKDKSVFGQEIRALFTLAIGLVFFLVTCTWVMDTKRLKNSWKYLTIGSMISLLWAAIQAFYILRQADQYPGWFEQVQAWFVVLSPSFSPKLQRLSGLTYEPSWFAHQMVLVYLPIWISAVINRTSAFKIRVAHVSVEHLLLFLGLIGFFLSSPRIGLISLFLMVLYLFLKVNIYIVRRVAKFLTTYRIFHRHSSTKRNWSPLPLFVGLLLGLAYGAAIGAVLFILSTRDWRLSLLVANPPTILEIWKLITLDQATWLDISHRLYFMERVVYWMNGWNVFNNYPWLGVGLGNAGFFFPQLAPAVGWASFEIRNALYYLPQLPNVKSLWFRLLAETGLVGFSVFISWLYLLYQSSKNTHHHPDPLIRTFAFAGLLSILAFIGEGFSIDSFAMPYFWIMAGLIAAIGLIYRQQNSRD